MGILNNVALGWLLVGHSVWNEWFKWIKYLLVQFWMVSEV